EALEVVQAQALRSRTIVRDLLTFVRRGEPRQLTRQSPGTILETLVRAMRPAFETGHVRLRVGCEDSSTPLDLDRSGFEQVITNLLTNALQAAGTGGAVDLRCQRRDEWYEVIVEDNGPGIDADHLPRLFEPFFTTKPTGQGVGLGLSVSLGIVRQLRGTLMAENRRDTKGARFIVRLPVATEALEPDSGPKGQAAIDTIAEHPASLLVIDDEPAIRTAMRRFFSRRGWEVDVAVDGQDGLERIAAREVPYDVILCDLKMPRMTGPELYDRLDAAFPAARDRLIFASGDVTSVGVAEFVARTSRPVLEKPFELAALSQLVDRMRRRRSRELPVDPQLPE
ncbi:MAG: hybrid sensor histidine kinase/response regulator, partial [Gemmatimonadaceae bacterium]|nr:hybrid sensor histidine kinase/response regulator [Gemmatimonadaceae bacterium]